VAPVHPLRLAVCLFVLMLPVTGLVPVLTGLTQGRYPGTSEFARHLFMSVNMIGAIVAAPLAGLASDSLGRRMPLIVGGLAVNGLSLLLLVGDWSYPAILLLRFMEGGAHMTSLSLLMTLGADHASRERLGGSMGAVGAAVSLGVAAGAPLGGWLGADDPLRVPWLGGLLMLGMVVLMPLLLRDPPRTGSRPSPRALVQALARNRRLFIPYLFAFVDRLTVGVIVSTFSLYLGAWLGLAPARIGLTMAAFLVPFSVLTWPSGALSRYWDRFGMMVAGSLLYGVFFMALGTVPADWLVVVMAAGGVTAAVMYAPSLVLTAELAGPDERASTLAGFNVAGSIGFALGPLLGGLLVGVFRSLEGGPYAAVFAVVGAIEIVVALAVIPVWRAGRHA